MYDVSKIRVFVIVGESCRWSREFVMLLASCVVVVSQRGLCVDYAQFAGESHHKAHPNAVSDVTLLL